MVLRAPALLVLAIALVAGPAGGAGGDEPEALSGGSATVRKSAKGAFSAPFPDLGDEVLKAVGFGRRLFRHNWPTARAAETALDGLGPLFNRMACSGCHERNGRGRPPATPGGRMKSMLVRLAVAGIGSGGAKPDPVYGDQFQDKGILGVAREGRVVIT